MIKSKVNKAIHKNINKQIKPMIKKRVHSQIKKSSKKLFDKIKDSESNPSTVQKRLGCKKGEKRLPGNQIIDVSQLYNKICSMQKILKGKLHENTSKSQTDKRKTVAMDKKNRQNKLIKKTQKNIRKYQKKGKAVTKNNQKKATDKVEAHAKDINKRAVGFVNRLTRKSLKWLDSVEVWWKKVITKLRQKECMTENEVEKIQALLPILPGKIDKLKKMVLQKSDSKFLAEGFLPGEEISQNSQLRKSQLEELANTMAKVYYDSVSKSSTTSLSENDTNIMESMLKTLASSQYGPGEHITPASIDPVATSNDDKDTWLFHPNIVPYYVPKSEPKPPKKLSQSAQVNKQAWLDLFKNFMISIYNKSQNHNITDTKLSQNDLKATQIILKGLSMVNGPVGNLEKNEIIYPATVDGWLELQQDYLYKIYDEANSGTSKTVQSQNDQNQLLDLLKTYSMTQDDSKQQKTDREGKDTATNIFSEKNLKMIHDDLCQELARITHQVAKTFGVLNGGGGEDRTVLPDEEVVEVIQE